MVELLIRDNSRVKSYTKHHNVRACSREVTDLNPLDEGLVRNTIGQTHGIKDVVLKTTLESGTKVGFSENDVRQFTHIFKGIYVFVKPSHNLLRNIRRDMLAYRKTKATNVRVVIRDKETKSVYFNEKLNISLNLDKTMEKIHKATMVICFPNYIN